MTTAERDLLVAIGLHLAAQLKAEHNYEATDLFTALDAVEREGATPAVASVSYSDVAATYPTTVAEALTVAVDAYLARLSDTSVPLGDEIALLKSRIVTLACNYVDALRATGRTGQEPR